MEQYPDTIFARMISSRWSHQSNNQEDAQDIFIGRNGARFEYVLDFMRDGKVYLPPSISREAFLQDLTYYGFKNVPDGAIESIFASSGRAAEQYKEEIVEACLRAQKELDYYALARECEEIAQCDETNDDGRDLFWLNFENYEPGYHRFRDVFLKYDSEFDKELFQKAFQECGASYQGQEQLSFESIIDFDRHHVEFGFKRMKNQSIWLILWWTYLIQTVGRKSWRKGFFL